MAKGDNQKVHWFDYVKEAAVNAIHAERPCNYIIGTVTSESPLKIKLSESDGLELEEDFLHLARNVTDFETEITVKSEYDWKTQPRAGGSGAAAYASHDHDIILKKKKIWIHNALKKGEKVLLIRKWGGQDYIVVDRVVM